jgi:hypothetical protein
MAGRPRVTDQVRAPEPAPADLEADLPTHQLLVAVAAAGLPGAPAMPTLPTRPARWRSLVAQAERQRILGLLVDVADRLLPPEDDRHRELVDLHRHWCTHDLRLERLLVRAAGRLDAEGIDVVVLKGPALAHTCYPDPSMRLFADVDLLVRSGRVRSAAAALGDELGASAELPELRPGFDDRFGKEVMLRTAPGPSTPDGVEIDLHRTLIAGALGLTIPLDELFIGTGSLVVGGRAVPVLGPVPRLLAACYQASISDHPPRLSAARDLAQLVHATPPPIDELLAAAARWRATAVVTDALIRTWRTLQLPDHPWVDEWLARAAPTRLERLLLAAHLAPGHVYWRQAAALLVLPGVEARWRYLSAIAAPQARYLEERTSSRAGHARRSWRSLSRPVREPAVRVARRLRRTIRPLT